MPRSAELYLQDILTAIERIEEYSAGLSFESFFSRPMVQDAVARNLEILGEAVKKLPEELKANQPAIDWKRISGLRNVLAHEYARIDLAIVWNVVTTKLAPLKEAVRGISEPGGGGGVGQL